jgi:hypothetical protein
MTGSVRRRFWWEAALAGVTGFLAVLTLFWHEWIEAFGFDPDHGDGSAEWSVVAVLAVVCVVTSVLARVEWRRPRLA